MENELNILLVEDNPSDEELLKQEFVKSGKKCSVICVRTKDAYEKELEARPPGIVISDYVLPQFSGMDALSILKEKKLDIPFIVVTGSINEETAAACIKAGAQDYVLKDHLKRLVPAVESAVEGFRARREKELAEERTRLLLENAGLPVVSLSGEGVILALNRAAARYLGGTTEDYSGKSLFEIFPGDYAERYLAAIKKVMASGKGYEVENRSIIRGEERWLSTNLQPVRTAGGEAIGAQLIIHDITEKRKVNEALRESEERYRKLVEFSSDAIAVHCEEQLVYVNNAAVKLIGAEKPQDLVGKNPISYIHPDYLEAAKEQIRKIYSEKGTIPCFYEKFIKVDGSVIDVEVYATYFTFKDKPSVQLVIRDITERKKAEDELRASEEKYRTVFESARDIVFVLARDGKISSLNPAFEMFCGWRPETWIGKEFYGLVHPDDHKSVESHITKCFDKEIPPVCEARLLTKGKGCRVFELKLTPLFKNAEVSGVQGIASDVTERKHAEVTVRKSRDFYQKLFDEIPNPMWSTNKEGKYNFFNKSWLQFRGKTLEEETERGWIRDVHEQDYKDIVASYTRAFEERERFTFSYRLKRYDGQYRWVVDFGRPYEDISGNFGGFIGICHDITDLKNTEDALRMNYQEQTVINTLLQVSLEDIELEDILLKVIENLLTMPCIGLGSCGAVYLAEKDAREFALKANKNCPEEITGGAKIPAGSGFCKEAIKSGRIEFVENLLGGPDEVSFKSGAGQYCCVPIRSAETVLGMIVLRLKREEKCLARSVDFLGTVARVVAGIIQRKQAEKEKKEYQQHLIQSSRLAALGEMAAGVAHEINNPLTIIMGNAQYLLEHEELDEKLLKMISEVNTASQRCKKIIAGLLGFSRQKEFEMKNCSLNALVEDVMRLCDNEMKINNVKPETHFTRDLPVLKASCTHLEQVFINIVLNAVQAMENGGVLTVSTALRADANCAEVSFADTGKGIAAKDIAKIFEPFFTTKPKGTGLGLAISYGLIKQHQGEIRVSSGGEGKGAVFTVSLPVKA